MGTIISQNIPYSAPTLSQQSTPIGAIIPYMGTTAPSGYLACDGGVYSISLYPLLAGFIEAQFGSINYFGGDGVTTFAVPNITETVDDAASNHNAYIIKAKSDRLDKITFAEVDDTSTADDVVWSAEKIREAIGPESYSTTEQWTGKYWIDGKKIYFKIAEITAPTVTTEGTAVTSDIDIGITNISRPISITGFWNPDNDNYLPMPYFANVANNQLKCTVLTNGKIRVVNMAGGYNGKKGYATVEYTKTTD